MKLLTIQVTGGDIGTLIRLIAHIACAPASAIPRLLTQRTEPTGLNASDLRDQLFTRRGTAVDAISHPRAPQGEMTLAERARGGMVDDPRPRRLRAPALTWDAVRAAANLEVMAAHLHWEALLDCEQRVQVRVPALVLVCPQRLDFRRRFVCARRYIVHCDDWCTLCGRLGIFHSQNSDNGATRSRRRSSVLGNAVSRLL